MITPILIDIFEKDLTRLSQEMTLYTNEESVWVVKEGISNSGGNLCLHIVGNLQHFIGAIIGESGYVRDRNAEFSLKNIALAKLAETIEETKTVVRDTLEQITKKEMESLYPIQVLNEPVSTQFFLIHLVNHMNYHLGQINYHRRLIGS